MTIKAFSEKYHINYNVAFNASKSVKPVSTLERDKDFSEDELFNSLIANYESKIRFHRMEILVLKTKIRMAKNLKKETVK